MKDHEATIQETAWDEMPEDAEGASARSRQNELRTRCKDVRGSLDLKSERPDLKKASGFLQVTLLSMK